MIKPTQLSGFLFGGPKGLGINKLLIEHFFRKLFERIVFTIS